MLNPAQRLYQSFFGAPVTDGYKAPHANRPAPPRVHWPRKTRARRLFKGHRS